MDRYNMLRISAIARNLREKVESGDFETACSYLGSIRQMYSELTRGDKKEFLENLPSLDENGEMIKRVIKEMVLNDFMYSELVASCNCLEESGKSMFGDYNAKANGKARRIYDRMERNIKNLGDEERQRLIKLLNKQENKLQLGFLKNKKFENKLDSYCYKASAKFNEETVKKLQDNYYYPSQASTLIKNTIENVIYQEELERKMAEDEQFDKEMQEALL